MLKEMRHQSKLTIASSLILMMVADVSFADTPVTNSSTTASYSSAIVNASGANAQVSGVQGGSASVLNNVGGGSAQGGSASASVSGIQGGAAQVSGVQGGASQSTSGGGVGIGSVSQVFEGSKVPPPMPNSITGPVISPTLFSIIGQTAQMGGIPILSQNFYATTKHDVAVGCSRGTKIVYNGTRLPKKAELKDRKVNFSFNGIAEGEVVGSITIQSKKGRADEVDFPTLIYDATHYIAGVHDLRGYNVTLLSIPNAITVGMGVDSKSDGFSLSPLVSGLANGGAGALLGLASGYSNTGGVTVPNSIIGCTFLVLIDSDNSRHVDISQVYKPNSPKEDVSNNGNNGKDGKQSDPPVKLKKKYNSVK
jgi:hypothetical protein